MKKYILIALVTVLSIGCKKSNVNPTITQADLLGTWKVDSIYSNNRMAYPSLTTIVIFKNDGHYTYVSNNHVYELTGNQIVLDHFVNADLGFKGNSLWIHENIGNPVPGHFQDVTYYLSH